MRGQKASAPFSLWFCVPVFPLVCRATGRAWGKMPRRTWLCVPSFPMVCQTKCSRAGITVTAAPLTTALRFGVSPHSFAVPQFPVVCPDAFCPSQPPAPCGWPCNGPRPLSHWIFATQFRHLCKPSSPGGVGGAGGIRYCLAACAATSWRKLSCSSPSARFRALTASSNLL